MRWDKRCRQMRCHRARLHGGHHEMWPFSSGFYRCGLQHHVQSGFGGAVTIPTAFVVVADATYTRRQLGVDAALVSSQQWEEMFEQQSGADGVDFKRTSQLRGVECAHVFFWPLPVYCECTRSIDDEVERAMRLRNERSRRSGHAGFVF